MTQNKGVEVLIAAYGMLKKKHKNLKLILKDQSNLYELKMKKVFKLRILIQKKKIKFLMTKCIKI